MEDPDREEASDEQPEEETNGEPEGQPDEQQDAGSEEDPDREGTPESQWTQHSDDLADFESPPHSDAPDESDAPDQSSISEASSSTGSTGSYHSLTGPCPWDHEVESDAEDCDCTCPRCPNGPRPRASGPDRIQFDEDEEMPDIPDPPAADDRPSLRTFLRNVPRRDGDGTLEIPREIGDEIARHVGEFAEGQHTSLHFPENPKDHHCMTWAMGQRPCTEMIPWRTRVRRWTLPCPNDRRGLNVRYPRRIWICHESTCPMDPRAYGPCPHSNDDPPGSPETPGGKRWVCEDHIEDQRVFWDEDKIYKAHLVGTCAAHKRALLRRFPNGRNTCSCRNLLGRWLCRRCYERKIDTLQRHFRSRVEPSFFGRADRAITRTQDYHLTWWRTRTMLARRHPCKHNCGRKRELHNEQVMDCRACGGLIVKPPRRSARFAARQGDAVEDPEPDNEPNDVDRQMDQCPTDEFQPQGRRLTEGRGFMKEKLEEDSSEEDYGDEDSSAAESSEEEEESQEDGGEEEEGEVEEGEGEESGEEEGQEEGVEQDGGEGTEVEEGGDEEEEDDENDDEE